eukprot:CAMPEP_0180228024 /NCGR_PEP_ID=MMETSP0987-20121128/24523_1 /TAXON_ID=697907 /ORGANISM="non described non described, Strain CCMP2293" /LENGTH=60 /DNA_ID=CAMNT_0022192151 /DNA_START=64 /DNA_END=243 /DNA_ORIENTATION=+
MRHVVPSSVFAWTSAPASTRHTTLAMCPNNVAPCNAVHPSFDDEPTSHPAASSSSSAHTL